MNPVIDQDRANFLQTKIATNPKLQLLPQWVRDQKELPVVSVPIEWVRFSTLNHRTRAEQKREISKSQTLGLFSEDPLGEMAQNAQLQILTTQYGFDELLTDLRKRGQRELAVVTAEGILINGNRRAAALRQLWFKEHAEKARYIKTFVLPSDADKNELIDLETELQVAKDLREEYSWVNEALLIEEIFEMTNKDWDKVAKRMRLDKDDVQTQYAKLQQLHQLVAMSNGTRYHADFDDNNSAFEELAKHIKGKSPREAASVRNVYFLGTLAGTKYRDLRHLKRPDASTFVHDEFVNEPTLKSLMSLADDSGDNEPHDIFDDVLGADDAPDSDHVNAVLSFLAKQKIDQVVDLPAGDTVTVEQLLGSVKSAVDAAAKEASEESKEARAALAPLNKLDNATSNINGAIKALAKARVQDDWDEEAFKAKVEEVKSAISQIEIM